MLHVHRTRHERASRISRSLGNAFENTTLQLVQLLGKSHHRPTRLRARRVLSCRIARAWSARGGRGAAPAAHGRHLATHRRGLVDAKLRLRTSLAGGGAVVRRLLLLLLLLLLLARRRASSTAQRVEITGKGPRRRVRACGGGRACAGVCASGVVTATDTQVAFDSIFPRRVLLNTSASVMKYWRDGEGFDGSGHIKYFDAIDKIEPPARIPSPGDLFLNVNLRQSHEAILRVFVPTDRIISSWVPCWRFGFAVKESTRGINYDVPIEVGVYKSIGQHYEIHDQFELVSMLIDIPSDVQITPGDISSATTSHNYNGITNDVVFHDIVKFSVFTTEIMTTNLKTHWWTPDFFWRDKYTKVIGARCGDVGSLYYSDIVVETRLTFEACEEKMDEWMNG